MRTVYLGLGCNLGDRLASLEQAVIMLIRLGEVTAQSKVYKSPPWGYDDDRSYLNMCCAIRTGLSIEAIHKATLEIEVALGRETKKRNAGEPYRARRMDIDILFFGNEIIQTAELMVPHPQLHRRNFVLKPMMDIAPEFVHPVFGLAMNELWKKSEDKTELQELD